MKKMLSIEVIERGLKDSDWSVRYAAMKYYQSKGLPVPIIRTIEPPEKVYKKCVGDVIVVAEIPADAQIRGSYSGKCRTNKAKIIDIIGDFAGEKVGISRHDKKTTYFIGDDVEVDDFDISNEECSKGFHFFCTLEQAKRYR